MVTSTDQSNSSAIPAVSPHIWHWISYKSQRNYLRAYSIQSTHIKHEARVSCSHCKHPGKYHNLCLYPHRSKKKKALSNLAFPWQIMRNEVHSATEMVNTSLNLLRQVKHIRWDDKIFIKVSPNHVGVKNYSSCIVQSADVDWAKINKQEFSLSQPSHEYLTDTDSLLFFWR